MSSFDDAWNVSPCGWHDCFQSSQSVPKQSVVGAGGELVVPIPSFSRIEDALTVLGARTGDRIHPDLPTLVIDDVGGADMEPLALRATFADWCGSVVPAASGLRLAETGAFTPAGVLAGAVGVAEIFQRVRGGTPMACRRAIGLDLWDLQRDWLRGESAPSPTRLPSEIWIVGMGNLGQAYLWTLGLCLTDRAPREWFCRTRTSSLSPISARRCSQRAR